MTDFYEYVKQKRNEKWRLRTKKGGFTIVPPFMKVWSNIDDFVPE